ncbi:uncharacterized protein PHALS_10166 [Plasmopara halstedii]|uniref:Uncharacterized protein n=1 Tax=Plasmopara halstedii TaxID=4781 RepID=A0A0P1AGA5_PLAHL|nr:uncharacterized protein PHALS_10166 [Plasmopara halstedii]CEG39941.1 hypothetical protein PHALS_10166 [Plasmopara halstedii]|eukprot:XP_024576310.1 hypothetical protein PHALS_10166 [Plasmopara halstedii]
MVQSRFNCLIPAFKMDFLNQNRPFHVDSGVPAFTIGCSSWAEQMPMLMKA